MAGVNNKAALLGTYALTDHQVTPSRHSAAPEGSSRLPGIPGIPPHLLSEQQPPTPKIKRTPQGTGPRLACTLLPLLEGRRSCAPTVSGPLPHMMMPPVMLMLCGALRRTGTKRRAELAC